MARSVRPLVSVLALCAVSHTAAGLVMLDGVDLESSTVRTLAGSPVTLPCPGLGHTPFVVSLTWLCRRCGESGGGAPRTLLLYRDGRARLAPGTEDSSPPAPPDSASAQPRLRLDAATFALVISRSRAGDTGDYFCLVNSRQQPKGAVRLEVRDAPGAPGRPLVLAFSSRTANISWTHPRRINFSPVLHYLIHVRETERGPWDRSLRTSGNQTGYHVTGLRPYTVYSFRVTAVNGVGAGRPGQPSFPVQTLREAPSGLVGEFQAVSRGPTSVQLSWRPAGPDSLHGEFLGYQLTYRSPATGANRSLAITEQNVTTLVVTGLEPFTEYLFSLSIRNPRGLGPSARVTGRTRQSVPGPPASVRYTSVGSTWAVLMWTPPPDRNGLLLHYTVNISREGRPDDLRQVAASEDGWLQYRADRLRPFTYYTIGVSAATAVGSGEQRAVRLRTDTAPPGPPRILGVRCVQGGATQVRWLGPSDPGPPAISFFTIGYRNERDAKYQLTRTPAGLGEHTIIMHNLDQGMTYFKIQAVRRSRYSSSAVYRGPFTEPWSALLPARQSGCSGFRLIHPVREKSTLAVVVGVLAGVGAVALVAFVTVLLCRRRARRGRPPLETKAARPDWHREAIPAHMFAGYVRDLQRGADAGFWKEMAAVDGAAGEARPPPTNGSTTGADDTGRHHVGTNGCTKPTEVSANTEPAVVEGYNTTYLLQDDDTSPLFWEIVRRHRVDTIVRFSKDKRQVGDPGSDWPALSAGCEVQHRPDSSGSLLLLPPPSPPHCLTTVSCPSCCPGGGRHEVRYLQLDCTSPPAAVRQYLLRQQHTSRAASAPVTVLVVTRGAEQSAALLVAADTLTRQMADSGDLSPVTVLAHLRRVRPGWFSDVAQVKALYQLLCEGLRTGENGN